jgi:hypothetical protein
MDDILTTLLNSLNETLTSTIVVVTASMLLYNLTRNLHNRVARTSAVVLACVTVVSICDVLVSLNPSAQPLDAIVRSQWIGIALIPAATFHLSDALLATTGLPSRGRRRRVIRLLYVIGIMFILAATLSDYLIHPIIRGNRLANILSRPLFPVYLAFFLIATSVAFINVQRARQRCLTRNTRRRMGYLQFAMLTPPFGIFPYSVLLNISETASVGMLVLVNTANIVLILMLLFLSYPISFFGSQQPDRVVKADLMHLMLRGPATALLALAAIIFIPPASTILGLPGNLFVPFAVVGIVLLWQWFIALALPWFEAKLIYADEDDDQLTKLQDLSARLLTRTDLLQLLEAILSSTCDYLQVNTAFVLRINDNAFELVSSIGPARPSVRWLEDEHETLRNLSTATRSEQTIQKWHSYWLTALFSSRITRANGEPQTIGILGIQARSSEVDFSVDEWGVFRKQTHQAAETLDDMVVQAEIYAALEGLLPQISMTRTRAAEVEYRPGYAQQIPAGTIGLDREQFVEQVRAALRHYWGGPGLTGSRLLDLRIVRRVMKDNGDNLARALRDVIQTAIDRQRPEGEQKMLSPEWTIYNILELRFVERHKVREVANRLALSEPDLYRKQRIAIEAVADTLLKMEQSEAMRQTDAAP